MRKKVLVVALAAIVVSILTMPVMAQTNQPVDSLGALSSNTYESTAGIFGNDMDSFIDYHSYSEVFPQDAEDETKYFGFVTGKTIMGGVLDAGFATVFGPVYLGVWYRGNIYKVNNASVTNSITPSYDNDRELLLQTTETTTYSGIKWQESANQIEVLVGVAGHGIKVGFLESLASDQNPGFVRNFTITDYRDGRKDYANETVNYQRSQGFIKPYLGWGTNFEIEDMKLMPYVDLGLQIYNDTLVDNYRSYTTINGVKQNVLGYVGEGQNNGYLLPYGVFGARLDLAKKNTVQTTVELSYGIGVQVYDNDHDASGLPGSTGGTVSWGGTGQYINRVTDYSDHTVTTTDITLYFNEQLSINHLITPSYKITGEPAENFKLGFYASLPISFGSSSSNQYNKQIVKTTTKYKWDTPGKVRNDETIYYTSDNETSNFGIDLNLALGASYQLIPGRFGINAGLRATPLRYSHSVTTSLPRSESSIQTIKETWDDGSVITNIKDVTPANAPDSVRVTDQWYQYAGGLYGGFTFNFNSKAALDLGCAYYSGSPSFELILDYVNIIFTFRF
jgi:hypothetical protein